MALKVIKRSLFETNEGNQNFQRQIYGKLPEVPFKSFDSKKIAIVIGNRTNFKDLKI